MFITPRMQRTVGISVCQTLESLTCIFAADSMDLCLLLFTQLSLKVER